MSDAVFISMFAAWAMHYGFRRGATIVGLILGLLASLVLSIVLDRAIPALPLIAVGYLLPNIDRVGGLLRPPPDRARTVSSRNDRAWSSNSQRNGRPV